MTSIPVLAQTYWSDDPRVCLLPEVLELSRLLPKQGEKRRVFIAGKNQVRGETHLLLWTPPISEMNGLTEQPSDLAAVMIIECHLRYLEQKIHRSFGEGHVYLADIASVEPIAQVALHIPEVSPAKFYEDAWRGKNWFGKAQQGDYLWLWGIPQEVHVTALIKIEGDHWRLLYQSWLTSWQEESLLMNALLDVEQMVLFRQLAEQAHIVRDSFPDYLILDSFS